MSIAWLCVSQKNVELVFQDKPTKMKEWGIMMFDSTSDNKSFVALPKGSIKKLIGRELTWEDKPVELKN